MLVGDNDTMDELLADNHYAWALGQVNDSIFGASAIISRAIAAKFARLADTTIEGLSVSYSQRVTQYNDMAVKFEAQAAKQGESLGPPIAGGISLSDMDSVREDTDRVPSVFEQDMFRTGSDNELRRQ